MALTRTTGDGLRQIDGEPLRISISEAMNRAPRMPACPEKPTWDENGYVYANTELGAIFPCQSENDRIMHTHTMSGHCFVWNYPNMTYEDGFRLFSYRSPDDWARVSIQARTLDTCRDGSGSRMYCGNWQDMAKARTVRLLDGEELVLLDFDKGYFYGPTAIDPAIAEAMKADVMNWWNGLPLVDVPELSS